MAVANAEHLSEAVVLLPYYYSTTTTSHDPIVLCIIAPPLLRLFGEDNIAIAVMLLHKHPLAHINTTDPNFQNGEASDSIFRVTFVSTHEQE